MHELTKNLRHKGYNPCGTLTGKEHELCNRALDGFFALSYEKVMRTILAKGLSDLEQKQNFRNIDALENWAACNLNDIEQRACITFEDSSTLQIGLAKYLTHVLYENRYNIQYNELVTYCRKFDDRTLNAALKRGVTADALEKKINSIAQEADFSATYYGLNEKLVIFITGTENNVSIIDDVFDVLGSIIR